ncbi:MAG: hypothetical protein GXP31_12985 [Kiritimatiellaeota bacterium]|nr:hypothetical protein [Kiritimatiellota bacterium]
MNFRISDTFTDSLAKRAGQWTNGNDIDGRGLKTFREQAGVFLLPLRNKKKELAGRMGSFRTTYTDRRAPVFLLEKNDFAIHSFANSFK